MSIATMAMGMKQSQIMSAVSTSMTKKALDTTELQAQGFIEMAESLPKFDGDVGAIFDVRA